MLRRNNKLLSLTIATLFVASSFIVPIGKNNVVYAKDKGNSISYKEAAKDTIENKINPKLKESFKKNKEVKFLVKLKEQVDAEKVAKESESKAKKQGLTISKADVVKRSTIVSELRIKADSTQVGLKKYLEQEKKKGNVKDYNSYYIVNGMAVTATEKVMNDIAAMPEVESIKPNTITPLFEIAKSQKSSSTAASNNIEWNLEKIGVPAVWNMGIDGTGIVVANIDTGVEWDHPALKTKYRGYNPQDPNNPTHEFNWFDATASHSPTPVAYHAHGTHTMGTMVGSEPNGTNKIGVAPGAKWIAVAGLTADGGSDADLISAGEWILAPKGNDGTPHSEKAPKVVNNSWGGSPTVDDWYRQVVRNWISAGIFPEFSAGNVTKNNPGGPGSVANPANYPESFATGATDINNNLGSFSLRGPSQYGGILKPEISAPGVNIRSCVPGKTYEGGWDGTSMAGPHTCGLVALLLQANSSLTVAQLEDIIKSTATPRTDSTYPTTPNNGYGYGVINAFDAVSSVLTGVGEVKGKVIKDGQDTVPPTLTHTPVTQAFVGMPITLTANAQDDISVSTVELQYKGSVGDQWTSVAAERKDGNYKSGNYEASIPSNAVTVPSISYRWKVVDFGGNEVISESFTVNVKSGITVSYSTDFETAPVDWVASGTPLWQLGKPASGPKAAASGEKVYATNLTGAYANKADMTLAMPLIQVPQAGNCALQFKHWYDTEKKYDQGFVRVSTDGKAWTNLKTYDGTSNGYVTEKIDLSSYAGRNIFISFYFKSDNSINKQGWYIDDVSLVNMTSSTAKKIKISTESNASAVESEKSAPPKFTGLPLEATVTVVQTGRSVNTNPADGSYSLKHASGDYTLKAETYGFYPQTKPITIVNKSVLDNINFTLAPIPKGTLTGKVTNAQTGKAIKDAKVYLIEDSAVAPVNTDDDGNYTLTAYEGDYTVQVMAGDYFSERFNITIKGNNTETKDIQLKPFIGYTGEVSYDDGSAENATAYYQAGNGYAVRMSLPEGKTSATVSGGLFKFWDTAFPNPGGTSFKVAIYDASGTDGAPGKLLAGPVAATAIRDKSQWTKVDLSALGAVVNGDFYMVYIQDTDNPNCPGIAMDENGTNAKRSWQFVSGGFKLADPKSGNAMIRAIVKYEASAPVITSPTNNLFTNNENVTITGKAAPNLDVHILNNGKEIAAGKPEAGGLFSFNVKLNDDVNVLTAYSSADNGNTETSAEVKVTVDKVKPVLTVTSPVNKSKTNKETVTVTGTVVDKYIDYVKVNNKKAAIDENGNWSVRIMLDEGTNQLNVVAADKAGNKVTNNISIDAKFGIQQITNLKPDKEATLKAGESVKIEFNCEPGLKKAVFMLHAPLVNNSKAAAEFLGITKGDSVIEFPMMEDEDENGNGTGHYVGYWTATSNIVMSGAQVEVKVTDWYGSVISKMASGKLYINVK